MAKSSELTTEQVMAFIAANPEALRQASATAAADLLNGPIIQAALDALTAAVAVSQDSVPATPGQPRQPGEEGARETLSRIVAAITLGRGNLAGRVAKLSPPATQEPPAPTEA